MREVRTGVEDNVIVSCFKCLLQAYYSQNDPPTIGTDWWLNLKCVSAQLTKAGIPAELQYIKASSMLQYKFEKKVIVWSTGTEQQSNFCWTSNWCGLKPSLLRLWVKIRCGWLAGLAVRVDRPWSSPNKLLWITHMVWWLKYLQRLYSWTLSTLLPFCCLFVGACSCENWGKYCSHECVYTCPILQSNWNLNVSLPFEQEGDIRHVQERTAGGDDDQYFVCTAI